MENKKTYPMHFHCDNCGNDFVESFEFGEVAHQGTCPHCGVSPNQLRKERIIRDQEIWM